MHVPVPFCPCACRSCMRRRHSQRTWIALCIGSFFVWQVAFGLQIIDFCSYSDKNKNCRYGDSPFRLRTVDLPRLLRVIKGSDFFNRKDLTGDFCGFLVDLVEPTPDGNTSQYLQSYQSKHGDDLSGLAQHVLKDLDCTRKLASRAETEKTSSLRGIDGNAAIDAMAKNLLGSALLGFDEAHTLTDVTSIEIVLLVAAATYGPTFITERSEQLAGFLAALIHEDIMKTAQFVAACAGPNPLPTFPLGLRNRMLMMLAR
mmetsp:Transcript_31378/g.78749  ORF Transcript_31378/g.78749 Transcript_31378/m.78749 type:complete len:258 (-) Transcript_31378:86-859(-)